MECCSLMSEDHGGLCTFRGLSGKFVILTSGLLVPYDSLPSPDFFGSMPQTQF